MKKEHIFIIIAGILSGGITFFGKFFAENGLSLYEIALIPYLISFLIILPVYFYRKHIITKKQLRIFIVYGLVISLLTLCEFGGVVLGVPVAVAVLLLYTQPIWTMLISRIWLKEEITVANIIACFLVVLGVFFLLGSEYLGDFRLSAGIIISIFGGVFLSLWIIMGRVSGLNDSSPIKTQFWSSFFTLVFLGILMPLLSIIITDPSVESFSWYHSFSIWLWLIFFAITIHIVSHLLMFAGLKKVQSKDAGIILLLEPVSAAVLASIFLGEKVTGMILVGGILILIGNYIVIRVSEE